MSAPLFRISKTAGRIALKFGVRYFSYLFYTYYKWSNCTCARAYPFSDLNNGSTLCYEIRYAVRHELTMRLAQVIGGEYRCTSAPAAVHPLKQIYSLLLVQRPKSVLLVSIFNRLMTIIHKFRPTQITGGE